MILDRKIIKAFIPYVGTLLIVCGYIKISLFYSHFSIKIIDYLEFSEVLILFLPDILKYGIIIFLIFFFNFMLKSKSEVLKEYKHQQGIADSSSFLERIKHHIYLNLGLALFSIMSIIFYLALLIKFRVSYLDILLVPVVLIFVLFLGEFRHKYKATYDDYFNPTYNNLIIIFFLFIFYSLTSVPDEIRDVKRKAKTIYSFEYQSEAIKTNDNLIYIGQTRNYLFLYNFEQQQSRVFKRGRLDNLRIKQTG